MSRSDFTKTFGPVPAGERTFFIRADPTKSEDIPQVPLVETDSEVVLHLSDIHFGKDYAYPERSGLGEYNLVDRLATDIHKLDVSVGLVVISGDLLTECDANDLPEAEDFIKVLASVLHIDPSRQVLVVPGNHDIPLSDRPDELVEAAITFKHERTFRDFLRKIHGFDCEIPRLWRVRLRNQLIEILLMNSVRLRHKPLKEYGYVDWPMYEALLEQSGASKNTCLRIAVLHHHLVSAMPVERPAHDRPISITLDAGEVIWGLQRYNFHLVLHGHQHVPGICRVSRGSRNESGHVTGLDAPIYVLGGGSAGAKRLYDAMPLNTYSVLWPRENGVEVEIRQYNKGKAPDRYLVASLPLLASSTGS